MRRLDCFGLDSRRTTTWEEHRQLLWVITSGTQDTPLTSLPPRSLQGKMTLSRDELERLSKSTARSQQSIETTDTSSRWSTVMFCHVFFTIINRVTKGQNSATESKACASVLYINFGSCERNLICSDLLGLAGKHLLSILFNEHFNNKGKMYMSKLIATCFHAENEISTL